MRNRDITTCSLLDALKAGWCPFSQGGLNLEFCSPVRLPLRHMTYMIFYTFSKTRKRIKLAQLIYIYIYILTLISQNGFLLATTSVCCILKCRNKSQLSSFLDYLSESVNAFTSVCDALRSSVLVYRLIH